MVVLLVSNLSNARSRGVAPRKSKQAAQSCYLLVSMGTADGMVTAILRLGESVQSN